MARILMFWHIGNNSFLNPNRSPVDNETFSRILEGFKYTASSVTGETKVFLHKRVCRSKCPSMEDVIDLYGREGLTDPFSIIRKYLEATHKTDEEVIVIYGERPNVTVR